MKIEKLAAMDEEEINKLIKEQFLCRIAFRGNLYPYIAPFQYVIVNDTMYFHFTKYGKKIKLLNDANAVCVEIEKYSPNLTQFAFVTLQGNLKLVEDPTERAIAIEKFALEGKRQLSENFLLAHGFAPGLKWDDFSQEKPLMIVRLFPIQKSGLKSKNYES